METSKESLLAGTKRQSRLLQSEAPASPVITKADLEAILGRLAAQEAQAVAQVNAIRGQRQAVEGMLSLIDQRCKALVASHEGQQAEPSDSPCTDQPNGRHPEAPSAEPPPEA